MDFKIDNSYNENYLNIGIIATATPAVVSKLNNCKYKFK